jgi:hypothetical protein
VASESNGIIRTPVRGSVKLSGVMWFSLRPPRPEPAEQDAAGQLEAGSLKDMLAE